MASRRVDRRLERASSTAATTSLLSVAGQGGLGIVGFRPIGDVGGAYVTPARPHRGYGRCAQRDTNGKWIEELRVVTHRADRGYLSWGGGNFEPKSFDEMVAFLRKGWDTALGRLLAECAALGGDGVVGVQLAEEKMGQDLLQFTALGTAVRYVGATHLQRPFSTTLSGSDVAKLVGAGYFPAAVVVAMGVGIRHNDYETVRAKRSFLTNVEVPAHTELLNAAKRAACDDMARTVAALGGHGAIVDGPLSVDLLETGCDYAAEVRIIANALLQFRQRASVGRTDTALDMSASRK